TIFEVADVLDRHPISGDHGARQYGHARVPVAVVARLQPLPPGDEYGLRHEQGTDWLPDRPPGREHRDDANGPGQHDPTAPPGSSTHVEENRAVHPDAGHGAREQRSSRENSQYEIDECPLLVAAAPCEGGWIHPPEPVSGPAIAQFTRTGFSEDSSSRLHSP